MTDGGPLQFLSEPEFRSGLLLGALASGVALVLGLWQARRRGALPLGGVALAGATLLALSDHREVPSGLVWGVVLLGLAGLTADLRWLPLPLAALLAVPGAACIAQNGELVDVHWIRVAVATGAVGFGWLVADFDRRWARDALAPVLLAVTVVGIYYCVPDTLEAHVLLGATLPIVVVAWPLPLARLGAAGAFASAGVIAWVVAEGGWGRQSSIVGGLATFGLLVLEPLTRFLRRRGWSPFDLLPTGVLRAPVAAVLHLSFVVVASRIAGAQDPTPHHKGEPLARGRVSSAVEIVGLQVAVALVAALALWVAFGRVAERREPLG